MKTRVEVMVALLVSAFILTLCAASAQAQAPPKSFDLIDWNGGKFVYGVDYYPEHWDEVQWERDAVMMQAAGINFVRLGEFAWVKMEPVEGKFDFAWLDRALKVLNVHGIKAVLGTPTASPPAWLYAKFPDIAAMDENGVRYRYGSRRNYCLHSPSFLAATRRVVSAMATHYRNHPGVIGWQIDNELGDPICYDPYCRAAFQKWCRAKYKTLEALNKAWGTIFWGHTYLAWTEIPLPWNTLGGAHNPSLALDHRRFHSDAMRDYLKLQAEILRKLSPGKAITHNDMGMYDGVDYSQLNAPLDFVAWDNYPMFGENYSDYAGTGLGHDLMRGSKNNQNFMVMEEQGGLPGWDIFWGRQAAPGLYRAWAYQAVAHGADGICYFRWRTSRYGTEQYWQGVLDQDSYPNARYQAVSQMGKELAQITGLLKGSKAVSPVALLVSPDSRWAFHIQPLVKDFDYNRQLRLYYSAFRRASVGVNVVFPQSDFTSYKVIVAPSLFVVDPALVAKLEDFVKKGGTLVLSYRSGVKDEHNVVTNQTLPGPLAEMAGIAIHDFDPQTNQEQELEDGEGERHPARIWFDILDLTTAGSIATYTKGYYAGKPGASFNQYGQGHVVYLGTELSKSESYSKLVGALAEAAGLTLGPSLPEGVELAAREKDGKRILFLLNYTDKPQTVSLGQALQNVLTGQSEPAEVSVPAFDVKVLVNP
ncbi:MAG: beta-galactosidase [Acidobacteriia bacterium]|nr:beta-galactosidase [Terriglobia bacterium]